MVVSNTMLKILYKVEDGRNYRSLKKEIIANQGVELFEEFCDETVVLAVYFRNILWLT